MLFACTLESLNERHPFEASTELREIMAVAAVPKGQEASARVFVPKGHNP